MKYISYLDKLEKYIKEKNIIISSFEDTYVYEKNEFNEKSSPKSCKKCGGVDFWQRLEGDYACSVCHPMLHDLVYGSGGSKNAS